MSGKPCGCVGKPKQDPDWRAESTEGHLLPQSWVVAAVCGHGLKTVPVTNCYNKIKKKETPEQKLLWPYLFLCSLRPGFCAEFRSVPVKFEQLELASFALVLISWSLHVKTQVSYTLCLLLLSCTGIASQWAPAEEEEQEEEMQVLPENVPLKCRVYEKKKTEKNLGGSARSHYQQVSLRSDEVHTKLRRSNRICNKATQPCLPDKVVSCIPPCENTIKYLQTLCRWNDFLDFVSLYGSDLVKKVFQENSSELKMKVLLCSAVCAQNFKRYCKPLYGSESELG